MPILHCVIFNPWLPSVVDNWKLALVHLVMSLIGLFQRDARTRQVPKRKENQKQNNANIRWLPSIQNMNCTTTTRSVWWRKNDMMMKDKVGPSTMSIPSGPTTNNGQQSLLKSSTRCMRPRDKRSRIVQNGHSCQCLVKRLESNTDVLKPSVSRSKPCAWAFSISEVTRSSKIYVRPGELMENQDTSLPEDNMQQASHWYHSMRLSGSSWSGFPHRFRPLRRKIKRDGSELNSIGLLDVLQDVSISYRAGWDDISRLRSCCDRDTAGSYAQDNSASRESAIPKGNTHHFSLLSNTQYTANQHDHVEELLATCPVKDDDLPVHIVRETAMKAHVVESGTKCPGAAVIRMGQPTDPGSWLCEGRCRQCSVCIYRGIAVDYSTTNRTIVSGPKYDLDILAVLVYKWLCCGRMLFSPARLQVEKERGSRILVIDGLGDGTCTGEAGKFTAN